MKARRAVSRLTRATVLFGILSSLQSAVALGENVIRVQEEGEKATEPAKGKQILNEHAFLPTFNIAPAFANTIAQLAMGTSFADFSDSEVLDAKNLKLAGFGPKMSGQVAFMDRFAVSFGLNGSAIAGMNTESLLRYGASISYGFNLGLLMEIIRSKSTVFSIAAEGERPKTYTISPLSSARDFLESLITGNDPNYVSSSVEVQWRPTLRVAHAFSSVFGLQGLFGGQFNTLKRNFTETDRTRLIIGLAFEADLNPAFSVPIGLIGTFLRRQGMTEGTATITTFSFGVFESVRRPFNVGLEVGPLQTGDFSTRQASVVFRTYFD